MAGHATTHDTSDERLVLGDRARGVYGAASFLAIAGFVAALVLGWFLGGSYMPLRRFFFAYLVAFCFFLSLSLGSLIIVLLQHVTRAAWSVGVRRILENVAALMPVLGILAIPLIVTVAIERGTVYRWALPLSRATPEAIHAAQNGEPDEEAETTATTSTQSEQVKSENPEVQPEGEAVEAPKLILDSVTLQKRGWMNPWFWIARVVVYFITWSIIAMWYRKQSLLQDETGDPELSRRMTYWAGLSLVIMGLTLTGAAGDFIMSLDPHWYSTMFGVYFFAGSFVSAWALPILITRLVQKAGYLSRSVTREHYHDLGKWLFGFTFFWGYIAFGQYMLLWYANIPEEIEWFNRHGATTVTRHITGWSYLILSLLFGQLLIPFAGLLSRHVKRAIAILTFWAAWVLTFHFLDVYWMVMPEYHVAGGPHWTAVSLIVDLAALLGMGGLLTVVLLRLMAPHSLRPAQDPRFPEALAFVNS
ncbi:MAG TPA: hypothetical protein VGI81_01175 [Tepidisphaeraceae bacterium]